MSRKYRQQGYQDSDRDSDRDDQPRREPSQAYQNLTSEEKIQRRSMRKATERAVNEIVRCPACGRSIPNFGTITRESSCPHCAASLHCCRACQHFDSAARWQCRTTIDEPVSGKSSPNDCSLFEPRLVLDSTGRRTTPPRGGGDGAKGKRGDDPRSAFEDLFKR